MSGHRRAQVSEVRSKLHSSETKVVAQCAENLQVWERQALNGMFNLDWRELEDDIMPQWELRR